MSRIERYVTDVMAEIPLAHPERERIARDLKAHLEETVEATGDEDEAVRRMGPAVDVARGYLQEAPCEIASVPSRVLAFFLDVLVGIVVLAAVAGTLAGVLFLSGQTTWGGEPGPITAMLLIGFVLTVSLLSVAYFPLMEWQLGQTLGKKLVGIHVVREDGRRRRRPGRGGPGRTPCATSS